LYSAKSELFALTHKILSYATVYSFILC